eukprot:566442-Pelagomonas_calceolata.AAC.1
MEHSGAFVKTVVGPINKFAQQRFKKFRCEIDEQLIKEVADVMVSPEVQKPCGLVFGCQIGAWYVGCVLGLERCRNICKGHIKADSTPSVSLFASWANKKRVYQPIPDIKLVMTRVCCNESVLQ